ncbi:MAG: hypothetical protein ACPGOY_03680 [Rhodospirillaceae bacterium]
MAVVGLGLASAPAWADCISAGSGQFNFFGKSGLVVTFVRNDVDRLTLRSSDSSYQKVLWSGRPFPGLTVTRPGNINSVDVLLDMADDYVGCALRLERY